MAISPGHYVKIEIILIFFLSLKIFGKINLAFTILDILKHAILWWN